MRRYNWRMSEKTLEVLAGALLRPRGLRPALAADVGRAVTGIAGPGGGTPEKPVGLTWVGLSSPWDEFARQFTWHGGRVENKEKSAQAALQALVDYLAQKAAGTES